MESTSLVAIPGSRLPEMLGNFQLDNHHVEEWSDPSAEPGQKHRARKEVGKWVNLEQNADIHYQKQEDSKHSDRSQERSRTEVIQGTAPDSSFQVVRSHRQYQDGDDRSGSTMQQSSSTSYHVSSARGVRSTTKTTSNKTTTKTVTVSGGGGGRADEFENLRMSFTPLDTSTQRERISVSRSGTMGIRRPPTRRHTPAALLCSSPEDGPEAQRPDEGQILVDSDDNLRDTPDPDVGKITGGEQSGMSIVGFKNISPKIRVGFPVEIQLELQTKLRSSSTLERSNHLQHHHHHHHHHHLDDENLMMRGDTQLDFDNHVSKEAGSNEPGIMETVVPIALGGLSSSVSSSRDSSFEFKKDRKKKAVSSTSLISGKFDGLSSVLALPSKDSLNGVLASSFRSSLHEFSSRLRDEADEPLSNGHGERNGRRMSWDLLQSIQQRRQQQTTEEVGDKLYSTMSSGTSSGGEDYTPTIRHNHGNLIDDDEDDLEYERNRRNSFTQRLRTINSNNNNNSINSINEEKKSVIMLNTSHEQLVNFTRQGSYEAENDSLKKSSSSGVEIVEEIDGTEESSTNDLHSYNRHSLHYPRHHDDQQESELSQMISTPDVLHHDSSSNSLSPSLERSRKLLKMLDETPDLINKMSFRSYFSGGSAGEKQESKDWADEDEEEDVGEKDDHMDWETQRQLSFLNDSLSRILDESRSIESINFKGESQIKTESYEQQYHHHHQNGRDHPAMLEVEQDTLDMNGNVKELGKTVQVSQTWISSVDHKPVQTARDKDVVTSISATNDAYKQKGQKKVEFCKTEVHFTPDSGRFNIVETDENKPSTAHLFRRKKRSERKKEQQQQQQNQSSSYSSSSSMSSLDSTTATLSTSEKSSETAYIVEMEVGNGVDGEDKQNDKIDMSVHQTLSKGPKSEENGSTVQIEEVSTIPEPNSLPLLASSFENGSKSDFELNGVVAGGHYDRRTSESRNSRVFVNLDSIVNSNNNNNGNNNLDDYEDDVRSPSHMILSNYGEMKIQRYLKQLKSPSSREGSSSPLGSPTPPQHHDDDDENDQQDEHFRFDNILYENGSFVPLATRRSLIEMNNRNRKRLNAAASQSSDNSSTTSTYSLPTSEKDQYGTLRMGSMEAIVTTSSSRPQITSVDFRYKHDSNGLVDTAPPSEDDSEKMDRMSSDIEYHNLSVKERRERFSSVPSPVMPNVYGTGAKNGKNNFRHSAVISPMESHASELNNRPLSSTYLSKKPPTPILPVQFASFEKTGAELRGRFYSKTSNNITSNNNHHHNSSSNGSILSPSNNDVNKATTLSTLVKKGEGKSKSIVTIGSYNDADVEEINSNSREMTVTTATMEDPLDEKEDPGEEPLLSLDHTWKGPAHYESHHHHHQQETCTSQSKSTAAVVGAKSLTLPKSMRAEPEWVSKAKSRETRVTDWSLIEKQQTTAQQSRNTEPPWISEIRFRNKPIPNEELKSLPKISVVYPWQRESNSSSKESSVERQEQQSSEESHIVSIIPEPALNGSNSSSTTTTTTIQRDSSNDKRFSSYDLYSGKSLPAIKSLKSVPEVSIPANRKTNNSRDSKINANKSIVEVHSEPEHYISSPTKYYNSNTIHAKTKDAMLGMEGFEVATTVSKSTSHSSSKKASSMRVTTDMGISSALTLNESKLEADTLPKKSRKPLQVTQQNKERTLRGVLREDKKHEEKYKTQPKPPKPPHRASSLTREEPITNGRSADGNFMMMTTARESSSRPSPHKERTSDTSVASQATTGTSKKPSSRRKAAAADVMYEGCSTSSTQPRREASHQPVHHRHPTIQITKLPMRTAKVAVVDGKRVTSSSSTSTANNNNSSSNKSKSKHHAKMPTVKDESKPKRDATAEVTRGCTSAQSSSSGGQDPGGRRAIHHNLEGDHNVAAPTSILRSGKSRRNVHQQTPLKTSTRSPSMELQTKKRKTNQTDQECMKGCNNGRRK